MQPFARPQDVNAYTVIVSKLSYIHELLLRRHDYDLYSHLEKMEIAPQIYGMYVNSQFPCVKNSRSTKKVILHL